MLFLTTLQSLGAAEFYEFYIRDAFQKKPVALGASSQHGWVDPFFRPINFDFSLGFEGLGVGR